VDYYSVLSHDFFFVMIFFKIIFIDFIIFNIELVENYNCKFLYETLTVFPYMIFLLFCYDFF